MNQELNILLIEDDDLFASAIQKMLTGGDSMHRIVHVTRAGAAMRELSSRSFDIILTDLTLPDAVRLECVEWLRNADPDLPLIVLTMLDSMELASEALQFGAQDFIVKDMINPALLTRSIQKSIERQKVVAENTRLIAALERQQFHLSEKNKRLKQLIDTAQRFADNVSHEFRTPLTVIREYAALMREGLLGDVNEQQAEFLDVIVYRVDDLNRMVDDMLDSSKLEAGLMGMHRVPVNPEEIVRVPLNGLRLKAQVRGVTLTFEAEGDLPLVFCDPEKAGRVLTNLVANAIKFTDDNSGLVHVAARHRLESDDVEFSVSDNGPGIDPDDLQSMFERFRQLGTSTQSSTKGFGLGLNIARELVELNYGSITVESEVDSGTTFRFTVPVDDWPGIVRRYAAHLVAQTIDSDIIVVRVCLADDSTAADCNDIEAFWRYTQRQSDIIRKTGPKEWRLLVACNADEIQHVIRRFQSEHAEVSRNRPQPLPQLMFETIGSFKATESNELLSAACENSLCLQ